MITIQDDRDLAVPFSPVCTYCRHATSRQKCKAFPEGIPAEIWQGDNPHTEPYPGDNGIQFERYVGGKDE